MQGIMILMNDFTQKCNKNIPSTSGIYSIKNISNDRIYIGSAANFYKRYNSHRSFLTHGTHINKFLQNDWNKTGDPSKFVFQIEMLCQKENLAQEEQKFLDKVFDNQKQCYNFLPIAGSTLGTKRTPETRQKISSSSLGKKKSKEHAEIIRFIKQRDEGIKINQYSIPDLKLLRTFNSIHEASRETNVHKPSISEAAEKIRGHSVSCGFAWSFANDSNPPVLNKQMLAKLAVPQNKRGLSPYDLSKNWKKEQVKIDQFDFSGNLIKTFDSLKQATIELGCSLGSIIACCKGRKEFFRGWIFAYHIEGNQTNEAISLNESSIPLASSAPSTDSIVSSISPSNSILSQTISRNVEFENSESIESTDSDNIDDYFDEGGYNEYEELDRECYV
jgi:predicted GIY-YIG superfamily endonuclease